MKKDAGRPYYEVWLRRARRELAPSGRLTEVALLLSRQGGGSCEVWRARLQVLLAGAGTPSLDLLMRIDALIAPAKSGGDGGDEVQDVLF
jgi:hypothetical protein